MKPLKKYSSKGATGKEVLHHSAKRPKLMTLITRKNLTFAFALIEALLVSAGLARHNGVPVIRAHFLYPISMIVAVLYVALLFAVPSRRDRQ
jgi:hypothetical protein